MSDQLLYKPEEAAQVLGLGRSKVFQLMAAGQIESVVIGRSRRVPRESLLAFVAGIRTAQRQPDPRPAA